nr:hypothetical protein [Baekduia alba]
MRGRLGVGVLAERQRALDEQRVVADVVPLEREGLAGPEAGVGQDGEQRGVALGGCRAHPLDGGRGERSGLLAAWEPSATDQPDGVGGDALGLDGALKEGTE